MASIIFCVYAALSALNLALGVSIAGKDYLATYTELPTSLPGVKRRPPPVMKARNWLQKHILDRIRGFGLTGWIVAIGETESHAPHCLEAGPHTCTHARGQA